MKKVCILIVATNKYREFVMPLLDGIEKNFLPNQKVEVCVFTNETFPIVNYGRLLIHQRIIPPYRFPDATLLRYFTFHSNRELLIDFDYLVYLDADTSVAEEVPDSFLGEIIAVRHPGFWYNNGWGSESTDPTSMAYIAPELRKKYFCGGTQGGETAKYLEICRRLSDNIQSDKERNVLAQHNDETHWNAALNWFIPLDYPNWVICEHTPEYCSVPELHQRQAWGIDHLPARIIALSKDHNYFRS